MPCLYWLILSWHTLYCASVSVDLEVYNELLFPILHFAKYLKKREKFLIIFFSYLTKFLSNKADVMIKYTCSTSLPYSSTKVFLS